MYVLMLPWQQVYWDRQQQRQRGMMLCVAVVAAECDHWEVVRGVVLLKGYVCESVGVAGDDLVCGMIGVEEVFVRDDFFLVVLLVEVFGLGDHRSVMCFEFLL